MAAARRARGGPAAAFLGASLLFFAVSYAPAGVLPHVAGDPAVASALYAVWSLTCLIVALVAVVRRSADRPVRILMAIGLTGLVLGDLLWGSADSGVLPLSNNGVSVADLCYVPGYAALAAAVVLVARRGLRGGGAGALLDALLVAGATAAASLPWVLHPYRDALISGALRDQALNVAYVVVDLAVMAAAAAAALTPGHGRTLRLLGLATGLRLVGDQVFTLQETRGGYEGGGWLDWLWLASYSLIALAVLRPETTTAPEPTSAARPVPARVVLLVLGTLLSPVLLVAAHFGFDDSGPTQEWTEALYGSATVVLVGLVCARLVLLLRENQRAVADLRGALAEQGRLAADLRHQAEHDFVTGLPNRYHLAERAAAAAGEGQGADALPDVVVFLDLDDFKAVNDTFGHPVGDLVLREIAERLRALCRPEDVVARLGGDEFAVLLRGAGTDAAMATAERLLEAVREPVAVAGRALVLAASAGVADLKAGADADGDGLARADLAMYAAKRAGKNRALQYAETMRREVLGDPGLAGDLARALRDGRLDAAYQPVVDLHTGRSDAVEALVRWTHPERGPLLPADFLPVAVERGLVADVDLFVLEHALAALAGWRTTAPHLRVSVNASAALLARDDVVDLVLAALTRHGLPGGALTLEVTEQSVLGDLDGAAGALQRLREHGVRIALDDFGTGYSSLSYLEELPVDVLKLDRSFLARGVLDGRASPLLRTVVRLGRELGMDVVAEGVETAEQHAVLHGIGCTRGQGWLYARAVPAAEVPALLAAPFTAPLQRTAV